MQALKLLAGQYSQARQVASGRVETFRALSIATGRHVFIHRVATAAEPAEQAELLKLMTTALVRSPDVKNLILDFGEEQGYWHVVTEGEPQCISLRDWLTSEINGSPAKDPAQVLREHQLEWMAMGEFARLFSATVPPKPKAMPAKAPVELIESIPAEPENGGADTPVDPVETHLDAFSAPTQELFVEPVAIPDPIPPVIQTIAPAPVEEPPMESDDSPLFVSSLPPSRHGKLKFLLSAILVLVALALAVLYFVYQ
jgi:hypothetical protein